MNGPGASKDGYRHVTGKVAVHLDRRTGRAADVDGPDATEIPHIRVLVQPAKAQRRLVG